VKFSDDILIKPGVNKHIPCHWGKDREIFKSKNYGLISIGYEDSCLFKNSLKLSAFLSDANCEIWEIVPMK
jgi:hypothetical protein